MSGRKQRRWKVRALHRLVWIVVCYRQWHCCTLHCSVLSWQLSSTDTVHCNALSGPVPSARAHPAYAKVSQRCIALQILQSPVNLWQWIWERLSLFVLRTNNSTLHKLNLIFTTLFRRVSLEKSSHCQEKGLVWVVSEMLKTGLLNNRSLP